MSRSLGTLTLDLIARIGGYEAGLGKAEREAQKRSKAIKKAFDDAGKGIGLALGAAFTGVSAGAIALTKSAIDTMDQVSKMSQSAGVATEAFSALAYASKLSGVEQDTLGKVLSKTNTMIAEGSKELQALGIATVDAAGNTKSADKVLLELADRFSNMADGAEKSAAAARIFGERYGPQLLPLLNQGAKGITALTKEAEMLGIVMDTETAKAAENFNDDLTRLGATATSVGIAMAKYMLPVLNEMTSATLRNARDFGILRGAFMGLYEVILGGVEPADLLEKQNAKTAASIAGLKREIELLTARGVSEDFQGGVLGQLRAELARLQKQATLTGQELVNQLNAAAGRNVFGRGVGFDDPRLPKLPVPSLDGGKPAKAVSVRAGPKADDPDADFRAYLNSLEQQIQKVEDLTVSEKLLDDLRRGSLTVSNEAQFTRLWGLAQEIDATKALTAEQEASDRRLQESNREVEARARTLAELGRQVFEATRTPAEALGIEIERLNMLLREGAIDWDTYGRAVATAQGEFERFKGPDLASQFGKSIASSFEDAIVNGEKFGDVVRSLEKDLIRLTTRKAFTDPLSDWLGAKFRGGGGGVPPNPFATGGGFLDGLFGKLFAGLFADGGLIPAGKFGIVGEAGPEFISGPANITPMGGGGVTVNQHFTISSPTDRRTQEQIAAAAGTGVQRALARIR